MLHRVLTSLMHPRLFTSLVLIEPVFDTSIHTCQGPSLTRMSTSRRDIWPSQEEAIKAAKHSYKHWDERVLQRWFKYGYRLLPTVIYPQSSPPCPEGESQTTFDLQNWIEQRWPNDGFRGLRPQKPSARPVTLATTKHQEVFSYLRPNFKGISPNEGTIFATSAPASETAVHSFMPAQIMEDLDRMQTTDVVGPPGTTTPFYRAEPIIANLALPHIRPSVLYIFGGRSPLSTSELRNSKTERTGVGIGGSGGMRFSKVKGIVIAKGSHLVPIEAVGGCADVTAPWLGEVAAKWKTDEAKFMADWEAKTVKERSMINTEWVEKLKSLL
jgi:hypothetical protein